MSAPRVYTSKTGGKVLGVKPDTMRHYFYALGIGYQPGGEGTTILFTLDDLLKIREQKQRRWSRVEQSEDREELGLGPMFNGDGSPRK